MHNATYRVHNNRANVISTALFAAHYYSNIVRMCPFALCHDYGFKFIRFHLSTSTHAARLANEPTTQLDSHRASQHFQHTVLYDGIVPAKKKKHTEHNERLQYLNSE